MNKTEELLEKIKQSSNIKKNARVYFKSSSKQPVYGRFVALDDELELWDKGFVRFVNISWLEAYEENPSVILTKIYSFAAILDIKIF